MWQVARSLAVVLCVATCATAGQHTFSGRHLDEALGLLQQDGLAIVFTSEIVTPDMRVTAEPRHGTARQQLDELLAPFGLKAESGPGRVILVVRDRQAAHGRPRNSRSTNRKQDAEVQPSNRQASAATYADRVTVLGWQEQMDRGASETTLDSRQLALAGSPLQSEALEAVHAMPRVLAVDDYHGDFSVRGSPYRQIGIVIDGVPTRWLQHTVYGRNDAGSLSMFGSDILDRASLQAGAFPRRYDDALGAQLELTLKEGSRDSTRVAGLIGGMSAAVVGEGPLGSDGRGSWVAGVRNSYRSWPPRRWSADDAAFAFADGHAKLVYDLSPTQQLSMTALGGRSTLDTLDEPLVGPLANGVDRAGLVTVAWRSTLSPRTVALQRVSFVGQELVTTLSTGQPGGRSENRELAYRGTVLHSVLGGVFEAGGDLARASGTRDAGLVGATEGASYDTAPTVAPYDAGLAALPDAFRATWTTRAVYANFAREIRRGLSFEGGVRISDSALVHQHAFVPWVLCAWGFRPGWALKASAGGSSQFPELDAVLGTTGSPGLLPERAAHVDVGIERRVSGALLEATIFNRVENDILRRPQPGLRRPMATVFEPPGPGVHRNALEGTARGVELVVRRDRPTGVSGWLSYTYARARQTDDTTGESYWSDLDRRHAFNAAGLFHIGRQASAGLVMRAASGVPIPGYFGVTHGRRVVGDVRNTLRLAPYVRLDARAQRTFFASRHAVTLFGEVLNVLNHHNEGPAEGSLQAATGEVVGLSRPLLPRRAWFGVEVNLSR